MFELGLVSFSFGEGPLLTLGNPGMMRGLLAAAGNSLSSQFSLFLVCVRTDVERSSAEREAGEALKNVIKQMGWIIQATESR